MDSTANGGTARHSHDISGMTCSSWVTDRHTPRPLLSAQNGGIKPANTWLHLWKLHASKCKPRKTRAHLTYAQGSGQARRGRNHQHWTADLAIGPRERKRMRWHHITWFTTSNSSEVKLHWRAEHRPGHFHWPTHFAVSRSQLHCNRLHLVLIELWTVL